MMKTIHTLWIALALTATCNFFTACSDDREPQWNPEISESEDLPTVGDGQFVVSYGASDGTSTRALSDVALPANQRISSLHYYVFEKKTGELIKRRKIRGINEQTKWPIKLRGDMPWELRQDLQDTLMAGPTYRILFIANIDSTLFKKTDNTVHRAVVRNDENYATAQILLPEVPFSDNNMYYLWEGELAETIKGQTTVKRNDVVLRRLVTRTDVERKEIASMEKHLEKVIDDVWYNDEEINKLIDTDIKNFCDRIVNQFNAYIIYNDLDPHAKRMAEFLNTENVKTKIKDTLKKEVLNNYKKLITDGDNYKQTGDWKSASKAEVTYQPKTRATVIGFDRKTLCDEKHPDTETVEVTNGIFNIVGFAAKNTDTTSDLNQLKLIKLLVSDTESYTLDGKSLQIGLELNRKYKACCDPISSIEFTGNNDYHPQVNFYTILDGDSTWEELKKIKNVLATLFGKIEDWVFDYGLGKENIYGDNFAKFTFPSINLPNLTADNVKDVTLVPSWTCE